MITDIYTKVTPLNKTIADASKHILTRLLKRQATIAMCDYNQRSSPTLGDRLNSLPFTIDSSDDGVVSQINYPSTIRFLDLKKTITGKKKKYYTPIYNKPLWGHIYGQGYSLSRVVNQALNQQHTNYYTAMKNVLTKIDL